MRARCACGRASCVYSDPAIEAFMVRIVAAHGPTVSVTGPGGTWLVPRHYYALHGLTAATLPRLAARYHWKRAA